MKLYMQMIQSSAAFLLVAVALLLVSCEKSEDIKDSYPASGDGLCMLLPPSIIVEPFGGGSASTRAASAIKEERQQFNVGEELGNIITLGNGETDTEEIAQTRANIASGVFYRIVIYTAAEYTAGTLKITEQRLCKTGSTTTYFGDAGDSTEPIYLHPGAYKIFCYSFNNATFIPKLSDGTSTIELKDGDDFMSTNILDKTITNANLGNNVNLGPITLYHRCCKLTGNLTAEGFNNNIITGTPSLSISGTFNQTGTWSITGSSFSKVSTLGSKTIPLSGSGASRTGSVIMLPFPSTTLKTTYSFKPTDAKAPVAKTDATLSSSITFSSGGNYTFTIKAIGAYVITEGVESIQIGSYTWATRNCRWDNTFETNLDIWNSGNLRGASQASSANEGVSSDYNSYFMWGNKSAFVDGGSYETGSSWSSTKNPCPSGYKVPTTDHFKDLVKKIVPNGKKVMINGEIHTIGNAYGFYNGSKARGMVLVDGSNVLFLPAAGCRYGTKWFYVGISGFYWSSVPNSSNAYYLEFDSGYINPESSYYRYRGDSVRCVK